MTIELARRLEQAQSEGNSPNACPRCGRHMAEHFGNRQQFVVTGTTVTQCKVQPLAYSGEEVSA